MLKQFSMPLTAFSDRIRPIPVNHALGRGERFWGILFQVYTDFSGLNGHTMWLYPRSLVIDNC